MYWNDELQVVAAVLYAMALGGSVGIERELKDRPAGFRTHMLVAGAAAFLVGTGWLALADAEQRGGNLLQMDPLRLIEAVVAGVSFIGAGTIFARRNQGTGNQATGNQGTGKPGPGDEGTMVGITTAASLLMVATIGIAVGLGFYLLALLVTVPTLVVLGALRRIERVMNRKLRDGGHEPAT